MATLYLSVKHYKDEGGVEHIDIDQTLTGGIQGTNEYRILDGTERSHEDHVFGNVLSKSRRVSLAEVDREWLKKEWLDDSLENGAIIFTCAKSDTEKSGTAWSSEQVKYLILANCDLLIGLRRHGVLSRSTARRGMRGASTSKGPERRSSKSAWCTTMVSKAAVFHSSELTGMHVDGPL